MILQALHRYYEILANERGSEIPLFGYSKANVSFAFNISSEGEILDVLDLREERQDGKKKKISPINIIVPQQVKRARGIRANFLCDNNKYILGVYIEKKGEVEKLRYSKEAFESFKKLNIELLKGVNSEDSKALISFLENWSPENIDKVAKINKMLKDLCTGSNIIFKLNGAQGYIHESAEIKKQWEEYISHNDEDKIGQCLITGRIAPITRLHQNIKGVKNAQSSGASIVSFNCTAYESYQKKQSFNAPVSKYATFTYTTALNYMLSNQRQRVQIGDTTTVFWAESPNNIYENLMAQLISPEHKKKNNQDEHIIDKKVQQLTCDVLKRIKEGKSINESDLANEIDTSTKFYILGLSSNASRLSVRFFYSCTFGSLVKKIGQHYKDMELEKDFPEKPDEIPLWQILNETVSKKGKEKIINPLLSGAMMMAILKGTAYPILLYKLILGRIRADVDDEKYKIRKVNYIRVSLIKAYLIRYARAHNKNKLREVIQMGLNEETTNVAYLLGRLFSVLEKAQQSANPKISSTIKDRYFNSACATPKGVFPLLLRLAQHHIGKSEYGSNYEKKIETIVNNISQFPSNLNLEEQGLFILGYYQQRNAFYHKKV